MGHARRIVLFAVASLGIPGVMAQSPEAAFPAPSPARIVDSVSDARLVQLRGNTPPLARTEFDRGLLDPNLPMTDLVLVLRRGAEQQAAFDAFVASQYDPKSSNYHHWLEPEQVGQQFGPAPADVSAVIAWLVDRGFTINEVSKDLLSIRFSGTVSLVQKAFHTEMHALAITHGTLAGEQHISNMADPQIPAALSPVVVGVKALHNFFPKPLHRLGTQVSIDAQTGSWHRQRDSASGGNVTNPAGSFARPAPLNGDSALETRPKPQFGTYNPYGDLVEDVAPYDFAAIYNVLPLWKASTPIDGTGEKIAIAATSNINLADVAAFRTAFGLPAKAPTVLITNSDPGNCPTFDASCAGDLIENTLDVEWAGAVAKGASIVLVTSSPTSPSSDALYLSENYIVQNKTASIMNVSYGECELVLGAAGNTQYLNLWQAAAAEGIAVFVASGDAGSPACDQGFDALDGVPYLALFGLSVSGLTSTPYNTSVGGTDLNWGTAAAPYWGSGNGTGASSALGYIPEVPWNSTCVNPLILPALQSDAQFLGVSGVVDAESACNFVGANAQTIYQDYGVNLAGLVDTIGGGGGASNCTVSAGNGDPGSCAGGYAKPSWQLGVTGIPNDSARDVPDVSFFASNGFLGSSYLICVSGGGATCTYSTTSEPTAQEVGGTSVASPAMAGIMALINQKSGAPQGNPNSLLYSLAAKQSYANCSAESVTTGSTSCIFNDIDTGTNAMACLNPAIQETFNCSVENPQDAAGILSGYKAGVGYDLATGLGSLNVANLINNLPTIAPFATLSTASLTFGATTVGTASAAQTITLKNTGKAALSLSGTGLGISIAATNASSFAQTNTCGASLAAAASCVITVTFKPTAAGNLTAAVSLSDNAYGSPQTVALSGTGLAPSPAVTLSAQSLSFGSTAVGSTNTAPAISLTNTGSGPLTLTSIAIAGTNASQYSQTNTCGATVAAGAACSITLVFKPTGAGTSTASLTFTDNAPNSPQTIAISGTATGYGPVVSLSPASLSFASTQVGSTAAAQKVTLSNSGTGILSLGAGSIAITGANATSFSQTNSCGTSIAASASCVITVTFKPTVTGSITASIQLTDNASNSPQSVALSGTGVSPSSAASLSSTTLAFGNSPVGVAAPAQQVTLTNTGGSLLSISAISVGGTNASSFKQTSTCGTTVAAGASCVLTVTFTPSTSGALAANLSIADNATGSPQKVSLTGTGAVAAVSLSPTSVTFANTIVGTAAPSQTVTLTNTGGAPLILNGTGEGITISGTNTTSFAQTNTCGNTVAVGASCTITVTYKPTLAGTPTASIRVADNAPTSPQKVNLTGTATAAKAIAALSPSNLTFPATLPGTVAASKSVTLTNTGNIALTLNGTNQGIRIGGTNASSFSQTNTCGASVAPAASCTITVAFKPNSVGALIANVGIYDNANPSPQSVALSGTGAAPAVTLSPTSLTFASTLVGSSAVTQKVTLTNSGNAALSLSGTGDGVTISGTNITSFSQVNTCGSSIAVGASCNITVTFKPVAAGTLTAAIRIADSASSSPQKATLTGVGAAPTAIITPFSLTYTATKAGTAAPSQSFSLINKGKVFLSLSGTGLGITITGTNATSFSQTNTCDTGLAAGASCTITVTFKPIALGSKVATLTIQENGTPPTLTVPLSGAGQ